MKPIWIDYVVYLGMCAVFCLVILLTIGVF